MKYNKSKLIRLKIFTDTGFALSCASFALAGALLLALLIITAPVEDDGGFYGRTAGTLTSFTVGGEGAVGLFSRLISLYSDRVFEGKFHTYFINDNYLKIGLVHSLILSALAALGMFFSKRAAGRALFDNLPLSHSMAKTVRTSALFFFLCAAVPTAVKYLMVTGQGDIKSLHTVSGLALSVVLFAMSLIIDGGGDLVPGEVSFEEGSGKTTAAARMHQNAGMLAGLLPVAAAVCAAFCGFVLFRLVTVLPLLGSNVLVKQDGEDILNSMLLGTVESAEYTPAALSLRFGYQLAAAVLGIVALVFGIRALRGLKKKDEAFSETTAKSFVKSALFALISSCVTFAGSLACFFMTGVRFTVPVFGFMCALALYVCAHVTRLCVRLKEEQERLKIEAEDDISDLNFVLH